MNPSNDLTYQLLSNQIQLLWNEEFSRELGFGKYSNWALNITSSQIIPMLSAIGRYGRVGEKCPDIDTKQIWYNSQRIELGLDEILGIKLFLNQEQQAALSFLGHFVDDCRNYTIPFEYSEESPQFVENVSWIMNPTSSDLFGIIWHLGLFGSRFERYIYSDENIPTCINGYTPRAQEPLICLMRVAQKQPTCYHCGGDRYPLRENYQTLYKN